MLHKIHHKSQVVFEGTRNEACPQTVKMDPCSAGLDMIIDSDIKLPWEDAEKSW